MDIRVAGIVKNSIVDGPGIRYTVFAQGCVHNCEGCHNKHTHDFSGGYLTQVDVIIDDIKKDPLLDGVTFSGGEPFEQVKAFSRLAGLIQSECDSFVFPRVICYTGYTFEELYGKPDTHILLEKVDVLIDGRFELEHKSLNRRLKFRGSKNQRVIDSKESVKCGKAIEISF